MYKLKWTRLQSEIFRLLCIKAGQNLNLRTIAKTLEVSPTAVSKATRELEKEGLIKIIKSPTMNLHAVSFHRENQKAVHHKRTENLKMIYESGLADFVHEQYPGCTIILFGSYSLGEDMCFGEKDERNSDIDLAVIGTTGSKKTDMTKYEKLLERAISINFYKSWESIHKHLKNNILNGILLSGGIEL